MVFDKIVNYFRGTVQQSIRDPVAPVWSRPRVAVDAGGDTVFLTCLEILAKFLAQIEWGLYGTDNAEMPNIMEHYRRALNLSPYPGINAFDFWHYMELCRLSYGNAYALIQYDNLTNLRGLVPLDPEQVRVYWDDANILDGARRIVYEYTDPVTQKAYTILPEEMFHVKAWSNNGIVGRRAIHVLGQTLRGRADAEGAIRTTVKNGFSGTIVLSYTSDLSEQKQKRLQSQIKELLANSDNTILPLPAGMSATNITNNVKDIYAAVRDVSAQDISAFFGIPLVLLNIGGGAGMATFSSNQMLQFHSGTIGPIVKQYATEMTVKLLTQRQQSRGYRFDSASDNFDYLDAQGKSQVLCAYTGAGILTPNEARRSLQYPASTEEQADKLVVRGGGGAIGDSGANEGGRGNKGVNGT